MSNFAADISLQDATEVIMESAQIGANVKPKSRDVNLTFYWGTTDGGTTDANWDSKYPDEGDNAITTSKTDSIF